MADEGSSGSGWGGCALWVVAFIVVILGGFIVGLAFKGSPDSASKATKPAVAATGATWKLKVNIDEAGDSCVEVNPADGAAAGQCGFALARPKGDTEAPSYITTSVPTDGGYVIFGPVPSNVANVRLKLADGTRPTVAVQKAEGVSFFVYSATVDLDGSSTLLDRGGKVVIPPTS